MIRFVRPILRTPWANLLPHEWAGRGGDADGEVLRALFLAALARSVETKKADKAADRNQPTLPAEHSTEKARSPSAPTRVYGLESN
jgi:hypothetical protein